jgi:hypothetical protein
MSIFFVSALVSVLLFSAIIYLESTGEQILRLVPSQAREKLGLVVLVVALSIIFLGISFALVAYLGARFHPATVLDDPILTIISSDAFRSAVFGVLFAAVFLHWVSHFHGFNLGSRASGPIDAVEPRAAPEAKTPDVEEQGSSGKGGPEGNRGSGPGYRQKYGF